MQLIIFMIYQKEIILPFFPKGFHLITEIILREIDFFPDSGILNLFIRHTSAALTINENADIDVRKDMEYIINELIPENNPAYAHTLEGSDDMPAHFKSSVIGSSINIPITSGKLNLGTWQGIYLCEFRRHPGNRMVVLTILY
jgi:secondary thiamine-phosphate synthase enzyme